MSEIKITIEIPGLSDAVNALAAAIRGNSPAPVGTQAAPVAPVAPAAPTQAFPTPAPPVAPAQTFPAPSASVTTHPWEAPAAPAPAPGQPAVPAAPAAGTVPTIEALSNAGAALCEKGMMQQLIALLGKYQCQAITQLKSEYIPAFAAELRALGAAI